MAGEHINATLQVGNMVLMNEWLIKLKEWWNNLAPREQMIVALGSTIVGVFIFYLIIWAPYLNRIDLMRKHIQTEQKTLAWMQAANAKIIKLEEQAKNRNAVITPVVLLGLLQKQINQAGLESHLTNLKQASSDSLELHFQKIEFDKLMQLLEKIVKEQNVTVAQFSATAENAPGIVNADMVLKLHT